MKKRMLLTVLSALTVLMLISSIVVKSYASLTDDKSDVQNKINEAKNALNDISDDKDEAETELQKITTQVTEAQKQLDTLAAQIDELNDTIDEKQKEILDSIHYAKRIQTALLPSEKYIDKSLKELKNK